MTHKEKRQSRMPVNLKKTEFAPAGVQAGSSFHPEVTSAGGKVQSKKLYRLKRKLLHLQEPLHLLCVHILRVGNFALTIHLQLVQKIWNNWKKIKSLKRSSECGKQWEFVLINYLSLSIQKGRQVRSYKFHTSPFGEFFWSSWKSFFIKCDYCKV